jgi:hypothetical protein
VNLIEMGVGSLAFGQGQSEKDWLILRDSNAACWFIQLRMAISAIAFSAESGLKSE